MRLRAGGVDVVDLTASNPTRVGLRYPPGLFDALASPAGLVYAPAPRGLPAARRAVASWLTRAAHEALGENSAGARIAAAPSIDPDRIVLTASTSEAYACLFKLLCDPGDRVLAPQPSYPLLEHLARLEGVELAPYPLRYHGTWETDVAALRAAVDSRTRAVVVVNPNNPTSSCLARADHAALTALCRAHGLRLIVDEVFGRYPLDPAPDSVRSVLPEPAGVLTFVLGGLSKAIGLPQVKLGWIVVDGPVTEADAALDALDLVLDTYLSVSTPVQLATERLLAEGAVVAEQIRARVTGNHRTLGRLAAAHPAATMLRAEGGWYAVLRVPATAPEETLALDLLERQRILVHPGYFFDFPHEAFLVVSLLPDPARFEAAAARVLRHTASGLRGRATAPAPAS